MKDVLDRLSTAAISDIMDRLGYLNQMLPIEIKPNFNEAKIFGKARIIKLKALVDDKNYKKVYDGLYFLESLGKGDVLVVSNALKDNSFFGDLMSNLARSKMVEGVVIDGCTRDKLETVKLKYPVFARDNYARDIKKRGIVDKVDDESTEIGGVKINKGDFLFGDLDGVIVIPQELKDFTIEQCLKVYDLEQNIKKYINNGTSIGKIIRKFGDF